MAKLSEGGRRCELLWAGGRWRGGRWRGGRSQQHGGSLPASKLPPARTVGALTDCADGRRTLGGRGALRKGRVPAHWPSGFSSWLPSTSGQRRKPKHGCVSYIDPLHRPVQPRFGTKVNIRYRGCPIRLGRANQPEFCLSPHQSRLLLADSTHTINRGREEERRGQNLEVELILLARPNTALPQPSKNCFSSLKKKKDFA